MRYKYLLWDIDGTVLDFEAAEKAAIKALFNRFGFMECTDSMVEQYSKINQKYWEALERKEKTKPQILVERFEEFFQTIGINPEKAKEFNAEYQLALGDTIVFCDNAMNLLKEFKKEHVLIAVTNGTKVAQSKKLSLSGLDQVFDAIYISEEVGFDKPSKKYFDAVFTDSEIKDKASAIIIGDSLTSDMLGGYNYQIATCWYNPKGKKNSMSFVPDYEITDLHQLIEIV